MAKTPQQVGQSTPGNVETDNASKQVFVQTIVSGTAFQVSVAQNATLYLDITTSAALAIAVGPTASTANTILASESAALGLLNVRVPAGWYVKVTGTPADFVATAILD